MKLLALINEEKAEAASAHELVEQIASEGFETEIYDWEGDEAEGIAKIYDVYSTPAFIVVQSDGHLIEMWQGSTLPTASDIKHLM